MAVGNRAFEVADCEEILLKDDKEVRIKTEGFGKLYAVVTGAEHGLYRADHLLPLRRRAAEPE